jgi:hypothetical protein
MDAAVLERPTTFSRVEDIKRAGGEQILPSDDRYWLVGSPLAVAVDGIIYTVPTGFATDGSSTKFAQSATAWQPWNPPQQWACVFHDWLYRQPGTDRRFADNAFRAVLQHEGSNWWQRQVMFGIQRVAGRRAYERGQWTGAWVCEL